jgi:hypothetical protein
VNLLNYWLGKLNKLQLLGHGRKPVRVYLNPSKEYEVVNVDYTDDEVIIHIAEKE